MKKNINLIVNGVKPEKVMYDTDNHSLVVLYSAQREFEREFKKGDILIDKENEHISICNGINRHLPSQYDSLIYYEIARERLTIRDRVLPNSNGWDYIEDVRLATPSEQQILFDALAKEGKKWNAETLQVEDLDISEIVYNLSSACSYLNKPVPDFKSLLLTISNEDFHKYKAQITLQLIREAWNKFDGFEVDWKNTAQQKYYPQVYVLDEYKNKISTANWITYASADSSCYYFESRERAKQFGNQFKELFKTAMGI